MPDPRQLVVNDFAQYGIWSLMIFLLAIMNNLPKEVKNVCGCFLIEQ